ncbi:unnamed protein product [Calicophoron daubneyi]|uniref:TIMELESS-interacting protein n=1 Tax=Calicophoron daubneyi TaxID=300641 RepID=A0AAV2TC04_CALDB
MKTPLKHVRVVVKTAAKSEIHSRFARSVLSSTRIVEGDEDEADKFQRPAVSTKQPRRRRLRMFDEDEEENTENIEPSSSSFLPSSIPVRTPSRVLSDEGSGSESENEGVSGGNRSESEEVLEEEEDVSIPSEDELPKSRFRKPLSERLRDGAAHIRSTSPDESVDGVQRSPPDGSTLNRATGEAEEVDEDVLNRLRKMSKGAAKRVPKNPRPKFDPPRLLGDNGLPALLKAFQNVKFKGKGHEFEDLDRLLFVYEAWANRLVPKSTFPEVIERLEKVGSRREIQVTLHRLRAGIWPPQMSNEFVENSDEEDQTEMPVQRREEDDEEAAWQRALQTVPTQPDRFAEHQLYRPSDSVAVNLRESSSSSSDDDQEVPSRTAESPEPSRLFPNPVPTTQPDEPVAGPSTMPLITTESRAERNRRLAMERLKARQSGIASTQPGLKSPAVSTPSVLKNALKAALNSSATLELSQANCISQSRSSVPEEPHTESVDHAPDTQNSPNDEPMIVTAPPNDCVLDSASTES